MALAHIAACAHACRLLDIGNQGFVRAQRRLHAAGTEKLCIPIALRCCIWSSPCGVPGCTLTASAEFRLLGLSTTRLLYIVYSRCAPIVHLFQHPSGVHILRQEAVDEPGDRRHGCWFGVACWSASALGAGGEESALWAGRTTSNDTTVRHKKRRTQYEGTGRNHLSRNKLSARRGKRRLCSLVPRAHNAHLRSR